MKRFIPLKLWPVAAGTILMMAVGCERDTVKVYHVDASDDATQTPPAVAASAVPIVTSNTMPMTMPPGLPAPDNSGLPQLKYVLPDGWQEKPASQMRVASFGVSENDKQADISVIPMGGMAGGATANVTCAGAPGWSAAGDGRRGGETRRENLRRRQASGFV